MRPMHVIIAGGGMVGSALACLLAGQSSAFRVTVIEPRAQEAGPPEGLWDLRVSAISRASRRVLEHAGAWEAIQGGRVSPYGRMQVWEGSDPSQALVFDAALVGEAELGHIIENTLVQWALLQRLQASPNASLIAGTVEGVDLTGREVTVAVSGQGTIAGHVLVGADGAASPCRRFVGIETRGWSYAQRAVVSTIGTERRHGETAYQRFLPGGPIALLPLADGQCSIVWSNPEAEAERILQLDPDGFAAAVTEASGGVLGAVLASHGRAAFTLRAQYASRYTLPRFALVGDAAHTVHPLAGQGVNLGFLDAAALAETLVVAADSGEDVGDLRVLRRYERWRKGENLAMLAAVDGLGRIFGTVAAPLPALRRLGLSAVGRMPAAREFFIRRAMGLAGDLPRWARQGRAA